MAVLPKSWDKDALVRLAHTLQEIETAKLRQPKQGHLQRWLHGPRYADLFVDIAPGGTLTWVELSFGGMLLAYEHGQLTTGTTNEMDVSEGYPAARLIQRDPVPRRDIIEAARVIFTHLRDEYLGQVLLTLLPLPVRWPASD